MEELNKEVLKLLSINRDKRVFSFMFEGKKYWLKQPQMGEANIWHTILFFLSKVTNNKFFIPTVVKDPKLSIYNEAIKLQKLKNSGIDVPSVILYSEDYIVIEDCGSVLSETISDNNVDETIKKELLGKFAKNLATMHNYGFYHSRPALRDATHKDGIIYFIDFEENLDGILSIDEAIIRDGFLFIHTLFRKISNQGLIFYAINEYKKNLKANVWENLLKEGKKYNILYFILKLIHNKIGKDAKAIFFVLDFLRSR